ncbi:MAG TPA: hypothetical protein VJ840_01875 [Gemmatimonadaceae bacterium]|nr:hypothetical protein [Gemmatimonadaceae bacterium]
MTFSIWKSSVFAMTLLLAPQMAFASLDQDEQQYTSLPGIRSEAFTGEIAYEFDSVLNQTTATFVAPLGKRDLLHRLFAVPTVHTLVVSYHFTGRVAADLPDSIRVRLESDAYVDSTSSHWFDVLGERTLDIAVGESTVQHSLSISQRIELDTHAGGISQNTVVAPDRQRFLQVRQTPLARVRRRATAWFSICEFLAMIAQPEIHGTVGGLGFSVSHEVVAGLNRFAAEMQPVGAQAIHPACG